MARDVKKKFTITLDIGTGDAEKQLKSTAENIKKTLKSLSDESNSLKYFNELGDMIAQIDAQMANLKATYGDGFDGLFDKISASVKSDFQSIFDFARKKLAEFNNDVQADKTHLDSLNAMMTDYKKAFKAGDQAFKLDKITGFKGTKKEVQGLYAEFDKLAEAKKNFEASGDFTSEAYIKNYIQLMRTAAGLINADRLSANEGKDFGIDIDALSNKAEQAKKIIQDMFEGTSKNPAYHASVFMHLDANIRAAMSSLDSWAEAWAEVMRDNIKAALSGESLVTQNKKSAESYNQLTAKVQEYIDAQKQLKTLEKGSQERKEALKRVGAIQGDILSMKDLDDDQAEGAYDIFEEINSGVISSKDAVNKLCGILQIDIPDGMSEMASAASAGFNTITKGADNASKAIQKVMYHLGNLLNGKGKKQDTFDEMPFNLTDAVQGNAKYEKYGFGVLGGGLFGVSDPSMIDQKDVVSSKLIHGVDLSKYNMYLADTEERASALMDFLSKLQKYAMKQAEPNYKGFDEQLNGINMDTLYDQFKVVFNESDLTKEKLNNFLTDMVGLLRQAGLKFDADLNELAFTSIGNLEGSENISTRFMKMLGYHGVNVGGTSFDGFGQGSVLFDFKDTDLVSYFNNVGQAVDDFNKRINDGSWDGSNEQLKQYRENIDAIIARLQEYEQKYQKPSITKNVNDTVAKLAQTKTVIDKLLSGSGDVGSGSLHTVTTTSDKIAVLSAELAAADAENARLRTALDHSVSNDAYNDLDEQAEQLKKENGLLEEKLELLTEIANQYGMSISKKDRDRLGALVDKEMDVGLTEKEEDRQFELGEKIEEADSAMQELGETYDKIILKLANGKNVEILPDDKGLRALDKIANEYYDGEYNGQEIQDVIFVRKQEQEVIAQANQQLQDQLKIQQQIAQATQAYNELSTAANKPTMDVATAFRELVKHISNSHSSPAIIFDHLEGTTLKVSDNLKEILQALNLIDSKGKVNLTSLKTGFTNKGGFVSDQYTMIARPDYYLGKIQSIQPKLQQAQKEGAQIGAIFDIIEDKAKGLIYEIQNTVPGESVLGHHSGKTNKDVLNASTAQIEGLVNTLQILSKNGLFVDWGGDNVLYDPQKGFSIIDMGDKGDKHFTVSAQNTLQENLDRMVKEIFKFSSLDMQQALKDGFVKNLYAGAQKIDSTVINPYTPKQTQAAKDAQAASTKTAAAVQREEAAHEENAAAIKAENDALQAQIELKKKAQSMKWEAFATDDSLAAFKQAAGMQTLGQLEAFWKKSNYEKQVDFHEITEAEAKQIFKDKLPKGLASAWYGSADFSAKSKLENEVLADNEIRNAAMNFLYQLYKKMPVSQQDPSVTDFQKFLDTEFTVYRGDKAPLIYDDQSKLSFSFKKSTAEGFNSQLGTAKIKPKDTIGNAGSGFYSEVETFINSYETSWYQKNREAFEDFYNQQTKEMQKEIDSGLVNFEKKRVSDILGDDLSTLTHKALKSSYWKHNVADDLSKGIIPDQITVPTDGSDYAQFADAYNGLTDTMKRFVMFFASMDELSASLPKQFSISTQTASGGFKYGKNAVGDGAKLFNAILNDPEGRHQHIAKLTGEQAFNLMGQTPQDINAEADARERNAKAIRAEAQAQQTLKAAQDAYDQVMYDLWDSVFDSDGRKKSDLSKVWSSLHDVQHTDQGIVDQGLYTQKSTGDSVQATDLFQLVVDIEHKYNENLDNIKDYLKQVYAGIDFSNVIPQQATFGTHADFKSTKLQVYETAKNAYKSGNQKKYFKILGMLNHLDDVDIARPADIANAEYEFNDSGRYYNISHLVEMVNRLETVYHENFDYVYDYLKQVYGEATIDNALSNLSGDGSGTSRVPAPKYTTLDYENVYSAAPVDMQAAIDDLAVFQQRYEQLYALTNTQPIDIMFPGKPTLNEVDQVIAAFEEFKSKQRQIFQLQLLDYEGNKEKIQELQAEAVGLQNKLLDASLGDNADISEYKLTYGFTDDQDADRFKKLVDMTEGVHTVMNDLTRIGEHKMSLIPQEMQDMLDSDTGDAAERFMALHAKQVQSAKAAAQQADANAVASKQQLKTEQDITAEKQRQASLTDQQAAQAPADAAQAQVAQTEAAAMGTLLQQVDAVKAAVIAKTDAFTAEGVAVEETVNKEVAALTQLKTLLDGIQSSLQLIFAANNWSLGDVNVSQDKTSSNSMPNILGEIKSILGQIYGVLSKSTGVEADNKNSANYKAPVVDTKAQDVDAYKYLADKLPKDAATESTLSAILAAVNQLIKAPKDSVDPDVMSVSAALLAASAELKGVASGIVQQQKMAKSDTSVAQARITKKDEYVKIKSAALGSLGDRALDSEVTEMQALSNGVVKVTGWLKVAEDAWEGFTVKVNEAGVASGLAIEKNTKAAKQAAAQAEQMKLYGQAAANQTQKPKSSYGINKNAYGATSVSTIQGRFNTLASQARQYAAGGWDDIAVAYQKAETALQNLIALQSQFQGKKMPDNHSQFVQYKDACNAANKELKKLIENADEFKKNAIAGSITNVQGDINVNSRTSRGEALKAYVQEMYGAKAVVRSFNEDMTELQFTIRNTDGTTETMTAAFNSAKTQIGALHGETKKAVTVFDLLGSKFAELWRYAVARMGVDDVIRAVRQGVESVREIDAALTDLKKVTNETDATYDAFLQTMSKTAGTVGSTVADLTQMAAEWSRLGYSLEEAGMLAESTAILLNVSEFDDATTASEALISTMQAFGYAADESQHVVDILNEVGNNYAVSSDGIATALQDSASALMEAGNSLEQSTALVAAANKVVQDPSSVGK